MPRDLEADRDTLSGMAPLVPLSSEPESGAPPASATASDGDIVSGGASSREALEYSADGRSTTTAHSKLGELSPLIETLNPTHLENCVTLENEACPASDVASREKLDYRLHVCGELWLGLFTTETLPDQPAALRRDGTDVTSSLTLIAYINATKTTSETITDDDMGFPASWRTAPGADAHLGHKEEGRTVAIHSLAVLPAYQKIGLGSTLLKAYLQRIQSADVADRVALLAHEHMVPFYERFGFENRGSSKATFGGGNWADMVLDLSNVDSAAVTAEEFDEFDDEDE